MLAEGSFGGRLRRARLDGGLSQSELELRSGIPKARLSRYENGHVLPSIGTLNRLSRALGVSEASLLGDHRATVEAFFDVIFARGVVIQSQEEAQKLAGAVADIYEALGRTVGEAEPDVAAAPIAEVMAADAPLAPPA